MPRFAPVVALSLPWLVAAAADGCSSGAIPSDLTPGHEVHRTWREHDADARLGAYRRDYRIVLPRGYTGRTRVPVLLYFHGWGSDYTCVDDKCSLANYGSTHGFVVVKPKGMSDGGPGSWNVGTANRTDTCREADVSLYNYTSCFETGVTSVCNCGTCYDDFKFVSDLVASLSGELCIDSGRIYGAGASFGALFNYYSAPVLADGTSFRFRGILPWYGAFYLNTQVVPKSIVGPSVFHFHGLLDTEIPPTGGESADGYLYVPVEETLQTYAASYGCAARPTALPTPFDGRGTLIGCREWHGCRPGLRVVRCDWREEHGFWPSFAEEMMWWFMDDVDLPRLLV